MFEQLEFGKLRKFEQLRVRPIVFITEKLGSYKEVLELKCDSFLAEVFIESIKYHHELVIGRIWNNVGLQNAANGPPCFRQKQIITISNHTTNLSHFVTLKTNFKLIH